MTALATDRDTPAKVGIYPHNGPVKGSTLLYTGALVAIAAGLLVPGSTTTGLIALGRNKKRADNSAGADSAINADIETGRAFRWANGDTIVAADIGKPAWIVDDQTVSKGSTGKSPAGIIIDVDAVGVWVYSSYDLSLALLAGATDAPQTATGTLVAGNVTISSLNITANSLIVPFRDVLGGTAGALSITSPTPGAPGSFIIHSASGTDTSTVRALVFG